MKRVTVLFDDEELYRSIKAEAAREGRTVKDVVAEALQGWLQGRDKISPEAAEQRARAVATLGELRSRVLPGESIDDLINEMREERTSFTGTSQVTLRKDVRDSLGVGEHDRVFIYVDGDRAILRPVRRRTVDELYGILKGRVPYQGHEAERAAAQDYVASHVLHGTPEDEP
jgi:bifunctional DNA-binding transcriptional regulator/antitoxin component of YhaV-PrlF toxin-antitoxin module